MFKRIMLALTFMAAFGVVGAGFTDTAQAWRGWRRPYVSYYYGAPRHYYYGYGTPYRTYYSSYYGPRYYRPYYAPYYGPRYYDGYRDYYYGPRVAFRIGW